MINIDDADTITGKIYPINSKGKDKQGNEYNYRNYEVFIPYDYLKVMKIGDHVYFYQYEGKVYMSSVQPDSSVPFDKIRVHAQRGISRCMNYNPEETSNNWKRFFTVPERFFPEVSEDKQVIFTLNFLEKEMFSDAPATLTMSIL